MTTRLRSAGLTALPLVLLLVSGCSTAREGQVASAYGDIEARTEAYHAAVIKLQDPTEILAESRRYADDVHMLSDNMTALCLQMMNSGMMGRDGYDGLLMAVHGFDESVDAHVQHMASLHDTDAMWDACNTWFTDSREMLDTIGQRLP